MASKFNEAISVFFYMAVVITAQYTLLDTDKYLNSNNDNFNEDVSKYLVP
jgi:hypothetical protein